jgi:hypothetical protein
MGSTGWTATAHPNCAQLITEPQCDQGRSTSRAGRGPAATTGADLIRWTPCCSRGHHLTTELRRRRRADPSRMFNPSRHRSAHRRRSDHGRPSHNARIRSADGSTKVSSLSPNDTAQLTKSFVHASDAAVRDFVPIDRMDDDVVEAAHSAKRRSTLERRPVGRVVAGGRAFASVSRRSRRIRVPDRTRPSACPQPSAGDHPRFRRTPCPSI